MKSTQVLKMAIAGKAFSVVYRENTTNPFVIYRYTYAATETGYRKRKTIEVKYADFKSCMIYLTNQF